MWNYIDRLITPFCGMAFIIGVSCYWYFRFPIKDRPPTVKPAIGTIFETSGIVLRKHPSLDEWVSVSRGDEIFEMQYFKTVSGRLNLQLITGDYIEIDQGTQFKIKQSPRKVTLILEKGDMVVNKKGIQSKSLFIESGIDRRTTPMEILKGEFKITKKGPENLLVTSLNPKSEIKVLTRKIQIRSGMSGVIEGDQFRPNSDQIIVSHPDNTGDVMLGPKREFLVRWLPIDFKGEVKILVGNSIRGLKPAYIMDINPSKRYLVAKFPEGSKYWQLVAESYGISGEAMFSPIFKSKFKKVIKPKLSLMAKNKEVGIGEPVQIQIDSPVGIKVSTLEVSNNFGFTGRKTRIAIDTNVIRLEKGLTKTSYFRAVGSMLGSRNWIYSQPLKVNVRSLRRNPAGRSR